MRNLALLGKPASFRSWLREQLSLYLNDCPTIQQKLQNTTYQQNYSIPHDSSRAVAS